MGRNGWLAVLVVSVLLLVVGGVGIFGAVGDDDMGTIRPTATASGSRFPAQDDAAAASTSSPSTSAPSAAERAAPKAAQEAPGRTPPPPTIARRDASLAALQAEATARTVPVRLRVPSVGLDVPLEGVGVRDDGLMEIPDDGARAGWYRFGPTPGDEAGSAVLAGHVDTPGGLGAMAALTEVPLDAEVEVEMDDGTVLRYRVVGRETIEKVELPVDELFDRTGPARLTLVTCGGPWRYEASSYRDNVVVVAVPVDDAG
ncbi:class F sortase [Ornithinimicrobium sp. LYQ103]|uniref:class F sortase n=1 Tax=Ornithinimicrobium sp. LYQ103 TaxID=3378796 RepID=UPI0038528D2A